MGQTSSNTLYVNFKDLQYWLLYKKEKDEKKDLIIINTLPDNNQNCLIKNTLSLHTEVNTINTLIKNANNIMIVIYGKHIHDHTTIKKYTQLTQLGFNKVYIYEGGLFEWICLHDIYGEELFPIDGVIQNPIDFEPDYNLFSPSRITM